MKLREKLQITDVEYSKIKTQIGNGKAILIEKESNSRYHYLIYYAGKEFHIVFDNKRHELITVL